MTIVTQDMELINYSSLRCVKIYLGEIEDEEKTVDVSVIVGYDKNTYSGDGDVISEAIQLGIYESAEECLEVLADFIESLEKHKEVFYMPVPKTKPKI